MDTVYEKQMRAKELQEKVKIASAAPALLDACIEALKHHQGAHSEIGHKLRDAIKKATE